MKIAHLLPLLGFAGLAVANAEVDFEKQILPLFEKACMECHKAPYEEDGRLKKPKGGLRLDAKWAIEMGGDGGALLTEGDPKTSELHVRVTLPEDDDDFMPPKGDPWTKEEVELVALWIKEGAKFGSWEGNLEGKPEEKKPEVYVSAVQVHYEQLADGLKLASDGNIAKVEEQGGRVTPLAVDNPLLRVDFLVERDNTTDDKVAAIGSISENIAQLELQRTKVTDAGLATVADLPRLTRLDLNSTEVGDEGMKHLSGLKNLQYLNLYQTKVSDAGLAEIGKIKSLKNVYLWKSEVTEAGAKKLQDQLPEAKVNFK
ncbi:MAG: c-type cytochrome domain-containing protein [Verrucomicrobiota bacterium]